MGRYNYFFIATIFIVIISFSSAFIPTSPDGYVSRKHDVLSSWTSMGNVLAVRSGAGCPIITDAYVYILGGENTGWVYRTVQRANLTNISAWTSLGTSVLPENHGWMSCVKIGDYAYIYGSVDGAVIRRSNVSNMTSWENMGSLSANPLMKYAHVIGDKVYIYGLDAAWADDIVFSANISTPYNFSIAYNFSGSSSISTVFKDDRLQKIYVLLWNKSIYTADFSSPLNFTYIGQTDQVNDVCHDSHSIVVGDYAYCLGRYMAATSNRANVNNLSHWEATSNIPTIIWGFNTFIVNKTVYIGGLDTSYLGTQILAKSYIHDPTPPTLNFSFSQNYEFTNYLLNINLTADETLLACNFTIDGGITNYSMTRSQNNESANITLNNILDNNYNATFRCFDDSNNTNLNTTIISFSVNSLRVLNITYSPSVSGDVIDPSMNISINLSIANMTFVNYTILEVYNGQNWTNYTFLKISGDNYSTSFVTDALPKNYTIRANILDNFGNVEISTNQNFSSEYDCTWQSTSDLGQAAGWDINKWIGNITINNTGDAEYANNCLLDFRLSYSLDEGRIYYDGEYLNNFKTYSISAKSNQTIQINATFGTIVKQESMIITLEEPRLRSNVRYRNTTSLLVTTQAGPYLYQKITSNPPSVYLTGVNFSLESYLRNLMGAVNVNENNTAYNVTSSWIIPEGFSVLEGNETQNYTNITDSNLNYRNLNLEFSSLADAISGVKSFSLVSLGYNLSGDLIQDVNGNTNITDSVNITFLCYNVSDSVCVTSCGYAQDPDCEQLITVVSGSGGSGGSGGGGGGSSVKTEATFELARGSNAEFNLEIKNKYPSTLENLKISVSGVNSEYLDISPTEIDKIEPYGKADIKVKINAPSYFNLKEYTLVFSISGSIVLNNSKNSYTETKYVKLRILELSREEADKLIADSKKYIGELNQSSYVNVNGDIQLAPYAFNLVKILELQAKADKSYADNDFALLKELSASIKSMYESAIKSREILVDLSEKINQAEKEGISVTETKKLLFLAESAFERGEFELALKRFEEAKLTYALETKGEFNLIYTIKQNPIKSAFILFGVSVLAGASTILARWKLYKRKLRILGEEETLLLELMRVVQRECFEKNTMSMEEYRVAMTQYEQRLNETIEDKIRVEASLANLMKIRGKRVALNIEQKRLTELIRKLQDSYLVKGKVETRIYEGMLKSYSSRLSEVEEQIAFLDAGEALKSRGFWSQLFRSKKSISNFLKKNNP